jgi:ribosomal protein L11 methyltransferase
MSYVLRWHVPDERLDSAIDLLSDLVPWGWEEVIKRKETILCLHVQERKQFKHLQQRIRRHWPEAELKAGKEKDTDWQTAWQFFFQPVEVADTFCILPPWKRDKDLQNSLIPVIIHPKMAFGTGHHPTTTLCLEALARIRSQGNWPPKSHILDVGTGSGILAIAAALLGSSCLALDIDPVAVDNARENIEANGVQGKVQLFCGDVSSLGPRCCYPLVIANILAGPLIRMAPVLADFVADQGILLLSGVLESQAESVAQAYAVQGLGNPQIAHSGEWTSLLWTEVQRKKTI